MSPSLSVVMPVHNEAPYLAATVEALLEASSRSAFDTDLVLVDDGSTDGSGAIVRSALGERMPLTVVGLPNSGRFAARRAGLEAATGDWVLLLDGRVRVHPDALAFAHDRVREDGRVWTGHVEVEAEGNPYGTFWKLIAELAWHEYFANPRDASFGAEEFDRFPKGTTCFLAPRAVLLDATASFRSRYEDLRNANDDTPLIRSIAERERVNISPRFSCSYQPRASLGSFIRHSVHRGVVFVDGHGRRESRFFPAVVAFYPLSAIVAFRALRRPSSLVRAAAVVSAAAAALGIRRRRSPFEIASLALLAPVYTAAHGAGMWRGLLAIVRQSSSDRG